MEPTSYYQEIVRKRKKENPHGHVPDRPKKETKPTLAPGDHKGSP